MLVSSSQKAAKSALGGASTPRSTVTFGGDDSDDNMSQVQDTQLQPQRRRLEKDDGFVKVRSEIGETMLGKDDDNDES